ncbi:MAG: HAD family hydrolase [Bacillota bacterium]|nr:HAD family hydrolase [Bacillota bacterium]
MNRKILFFDVDGTLMGYDHVIPESTRLSLKETREKGNLVFVNSGRPVGTLRGVMEMMDGLVDGWICGCGTELIDGDQSILYYKMSQEQEQKIRSLQDDCEIAIFLEGRKGWQNLADDAFRLRHPGLRVFFEKMEAFNALDGKESREAYFEASKFCAKSDEKTDLEKFKRLVDEYGFDVIDRNGMFFECVPKGYSKGIGVTKMLQHLNISPEESFAFGDSTNDIEMFRACGTAVAMGKHDPELTAYADYITTDLNDDGIRRAMKHFSLI